MSQIPFFLVTGFLGSGKTTFLKRTLRNHQGAKIGIIQNEFAPSNIDGTDIRQDFDNFKILEINNGSVFCVCLLSDFMSSLCSFVDEYQPDMLFLESSGLADPIAITQMLEFKELKKRIYLSRVWTIIDSAQFLSQKKLVTRLEHQVRIADVLVMNKTDLSNETQLAELEKTIKLLNPFAEIIKTSFCAMDIDLGEIIMKTTQTNAEKTREINQQFESCERPDVGVGVLKTTKAITEENLKTFIGIYADKTIRIKGFAKLINRKCMAVQSSYGEVDFKHAKCHDGPTEIIAIGDDFDLSEFSRSYRALAE